METKIFNFTQISVKAFFIIFINIILSKQLIVSPCVEAVQILQHLAASDCLSWDLVSSSDPLPCQLSVKTLPDVVQHG